MTLRDILVIHPEWIDMELVMYVQYNESFVPADDVCFTELNDGRLAI